MAYRLIIFDFDGTLADTFPWFVSVLDDVADHFQFRRLAQDEIETLRECDARQLLKSHGVPLWKVPLIARYLTGRLARDAARIPLFTGVDDLLRGLAERNVEMALASSNAERNVTTILGPERMRRFGHRECGVPLFGKAARLRKIVSRSGFDPREVLCVGDEIRDIEAARAARLDCGAVSWGYTRAEALAAHAPDALFSSMEEILETVLPPREGTAHPAR